MASIDKVRKKIGNIFVASEELADVPLVPRQRVVLASDIAAISSVAGAAAGLGAALAAAASDMTLLTVIVAGLAAVILAGGLAVVVADSIINREKFAGLDWFMMDRGIVWWVRVHSPEQENAALRVLSHYGAGAVRVHEIEIDRPV